MSYNSKGRRMPPKAAQAQEQTWCSVSERRNTPAGMAGPIKIGYSQSKGKAAAFNPKRKDFHWPSNTDSVAGRLVRTFADSCIDLCPLHETGKPAIALRAVWAQERGVFPTGVTKSDSPSPRPAPGNLSGPLGLWPSGTSGDGLGGFSREFFPRARAFKGLPSWAQTPLFGRSTDARLGDQACDAHQ